MTKNTGTRLAASVLVFFINFLLILLKKFDTLLLKYTFERGDNMPESPIHRGLRNRAATILKAYGWDVTHDNGDIRIPDILARKGLRKWLIEIEYSGSNIERDLRQGAQIFITTPARLAIIRRLVAGEAPVVDINGFRARVRAKG